MGRDDKTAGDKTRVTVKEKRGDKTITQDQYTARKYNTR
jgi:hypothetical protein